MKLKLFILLITISFVHLQLRADRLKIDSLINLTVNEKNDSIRLALYNQIGSASYKVEQHVAKNYWSKALELANKLSKNNRTSFYLNQLSTTYNGLGIISRRTGNYAQALEFYQKCIKINEELNNQSDLGSIYMNIGVIYRDLEDYDKAIFYYDKSLNIRLNGDNKTALSDTYNSFGILYRRMKQHDKALDFYNKSLEISTLLDDKDNMAQSYNNIGVINMLDKNYNEAKNYFKQAFNIYEKLGIEAGIARFHSNMSKLYESIGDISKAIAESENSYEILSGIGRRKDMLEEAKQLSDLYAKKGRYKQSLDFYKKHINLRDSVFSESSLNDVAQKEMQFEFDKKILADSLARAEEERIQQIEYQQELNTQKMYMYGGGFILLLVLIFSSIIFNRLKITSKQKHVIEQQKLIVEEKNKEITDSITYAKRIQTAMLPSIEKIREALPASFVYYQPKDIVAGDFYWFTKKANKILIAVADCTGHGVPGAMVSVVCHNALNRAVGDFDLVNPAEILDKTAELVIEAFKKNNEDVNDGMDISLCCFDMENNKLEFSGAINSLFYIRENNLIEVKGDKQPIGQYAEIKPFTNHLIDLLPNDKFYLFSDGYPDQFGGEKGKKYMYKRFRDLILGISNDEFSKQESKLKMEFNTWKQDLDQVDDVCIIGVKV